MEIEEYIVSDKYDGRMKKLYPTPCQLCDKPFYVPKSRIGKAKFCSITCSTEHQKRVRLANRPVSLMPKREPKYRVGPRLPGSR